MAQEQDTCTTDKCPVFALTPCSLSPFDMHRRPRSRRLSPTLTGGGGCGHSVVTISRFVTRHRENAAARGQRSFRERLPAPPVNTLPAHARSHPNQLGIFNTSSLLDALHKNKKKKTHPNCKAFVHTNGKESWADLSSSRKTSRTAWAWRAAEQPAPLPAAPPRVSWACPRH